MTSIYGYEDVANHAMMLIDEVRMTAFAEAVRRVIRPGEIVVDIGAGSGILSLLCAKAGAAHVYAIERGPMASLIGPAAHENGVGDIIEVINNDARSVVFPANALPTVVVSEMIGSFGIDEDFISLLGDVAKKCAPGVRYLPASVEVKLALASIPELTKELTLVSGDLNIKLSALRARLIHRPVLAHIEAPTLLSQAAGARFLPGSGRVTAVTGTVRAERSAPANAIVSWFDSELCEGVVLSSSPSNPATHWAQVVFPIDPPIDVVAGDAVDIEVRPRLITDRGTYSWSARRGADVRHGDAMQSFVGTKDDMLAQLGIRLKDGKENP